MNEALAEYFKHNLWANQRLLDACATLTDEQLDASVVGTYGSVRDTIGHLVGAERRYVERLKEQEPDDTVHESKGFPGFDVLRESTRRSGEELVSIAEQFDPKQILKGTWRGEPYEMKAVIVLVQAINHATEHRAHIATIVSQQGIEPPDLDGWAYGEF